MVRDGFFRGCMRYSIVIDREQAAEYPEGLRTRGRVGFSILIGPLILAAEVGFCLFLL